MKCINCGGPLEGTMTFCPFCGVRQDIDLRQVNYRDLGTNASMPCPQCATPLGVIEFNTDPAISVERCPDCKGMFFNPGELEALLDSQTNSLVWLDSEQLKQLDQEVLEIGGVVYRKCPVCNERMSPLNFGGHSGVIIDRCGPHGFWLDGGELRRIKEWWWAGGKLIYQQNEEKRTEMLYGSAVRPLS